MAVAPTDDPKRGSLRLWPGAVLVTLLWLVWFGLPAIMPDGGLYAVLGGLVGGLLIVLWWLLFSRAPWLERLGIVALMIVGLLVTSRLVDVSVANAGMGFLFTIFAIPMVSSAIVLGATLGRNLPDRSRRLTIAATVLLACGAWTLVRIGGISNSGSTEFAWRWTATPEERLLARAGGEAVMADEALVAAAMDSGVGWPGFRGPGRDSKVRGVRIDTDWTDTPPVELWRRPVGPGWSSFAVRGQLFYTQEQRGEEEIVAAYALGTGEPVWMHRDATRFWEANAGAGPRATPTLSGDRLYAFGATGTLNALDAADGSVMWSRDVGADTGVAVPYWGFSSSPLVIDDLVVVAAAGRLAAYDRDSGEARWFGPDGGAGYSSPHRLTIDGISQILLASVSGVVSLRPDDGELLWEHAWPGALRIVQPALTEDGDLLVSRGETTGIRRITVYRSADGWSTEEVWTSNRLKPYFSDFVVHGDHAYGFDGSIMACIDVASGDRVWKGGRYGGGQLVLLAEQDVLLIISEDGELALVRATPDRFTELARFPAFDGKTWNHPVLVGDVLLVRNDRQMAAFRLALPSS
jgi:outer membrane protein assembly factor BamB